MDSVAIASKLQEDKKNSLENELKELKQKKPMMESALMQAKADLAGAKTMMQSIQGFHLGRQAYDKAQQVKQQTLVIENVFYFFQEFNQNFLPKCVSIEWRRD